MIWNKKFKILINNWNKILEKNWNYVKIKKKMKCDHK